MQTSPILLAAATALSLVACQAEEEGADAYGHFEATEIMVSAEQAGPILQFRVNEGDLLKKGEVVGLIDTMPLQLQREEVLSKLQAINLKTQDPGSNIEVLEERRKNLVRERDRTEALVKGKAATARQLDDLVGQIEVVDREIASQRTQAGIANRGILSERKPLEARLKQIEDQIARCIIKNPADGTVLLKIAQAGEMAAPGKLLYKLADLSTMELKVYVTGTQVPHLKIGQEVDVQIDLDETQNQSLSGNINWIASRAEFTPKTIQTKEERVNLVYAIKIDVPNDGRLKIGMPGELHLDQ